MSMFVPTADELRSLNKRNADIEGTQEDAIFKTRQTILSFYNSLVNNELDVILRPRKSNPSFINLGGEVQIHFPSYKLKVLFKEMFEAVCVEFEPLGYEVQMNTTFSNHIIISWNTEKINMKQYSESLSTCCPVPTANELRTIETRHNNLFGTPDYAILTAKQRILSCYHRNNSIEGSISLKFNDSYLKVPFEKIVEAIRSEFEPLNYEIYSYQELLRTGRSVVVIKWQTREISAKRYPELYENEDIKSKIKEDQRSDLKEEGKIVSTCCNANELQILEIRNIDFRGTTEYAVHRARTCILSFYNNLQKRHFGGDGIIEVTFHKQDTKVSFKEIFEAIYDEFKLFGYEIDCYTPTDLPKVFVVTFKWQTKEVQKTLYPYMAKYIDGYSFILNWHP